MRQYPTDYRMWALASSVLFVPTLVVGTVYGDLVPRDRFVRIVMDVFWLAVASAIVGWVIQAIAVVFGIRIHFHADAQHEADYDDAVRPEPKER